MKSKKNNLLIFGEVLFDCFPDKQKVLGGAPFNVAWNLKHLSQDPTLISCIGDDDLGKEIIETMEKTGLSTKGVQLNTVYPTGKVEVTFKEDEPVFNINPDQAYDHIKRPKIDIAENSILYHGSLALRGDNSRETLFTLREKAESVFVDLNIRKPWFRLEVAEVCLNGIDWLKVNDYEYKIIMGSRFKHDEMMISDTRNYMKKHEIKNMIITCGSKGSWFISDNLAFYTNAEHVDNFVDSVGAGDCFSAVCLFGIVQGWNPEVMMQRASKAAAFICTKQGATVQELGHCKGLTEEWY